MKQQNRDPASVIRDIPELVGKTIASAKQEAGDFHGLDEGYATDGPVVLQFTDGSTASIQGSWCNDSTAATNFKFAVRGGSPNRS